MLRKFARYCYIKLLTHGDLLVSRFVTRVSGEPVVIVRLDAIGDFVLWLPFAESYRKLYPGRKIVLVANSTWSDFAELFPYWDEVWQLRINDFKNNLAYRWKFIRKISQAGFETAIQPSFSRVFVGGDSLIRATRARHRIGSVGDYSNIWRQHKVISDQWYTKLVPASSKPLMELERNAEFIRDLGCESRESVFGCWPLHTPLSPDLVVEEPYFIIFPGASWKGRIWPIDRFASLAHWVARKFGLRVVVCGSLGDVPLAGALIDLIGLPNAINLAGKTSLAEFAEVVRRAKMLVGNETSAIHLAAAVGTPSVCLLGGGHFGRFMPYPGDWSDCKPIPVYQLMDCYGCNWRCSKPYMKDGCVPCIAAIDVDSVKVAVQEALDSHLSSAR